MNTVCEFEYTNRPMRAPEVVGAFLGVAFLLAVLIGMAIRFSSPIFVISLALGSPVIFMLLARVIRGAKDVFFVDPFLKKLSKKSEYTITSQPDFLYRWSGQGNTLNAVNKDGQKVRLHVVINPSSSERWNHYDVSVNQHVEDLVPA